VFITGTKKEHNDRPGVAVIGEQRLICVDSAPSTHFHPTIPALDILPSSSGNDWRSKLSGVALHEDEIKLLDVSLALVC